VRPPGGDAGEVAERDPQAGWTRKNHRSRFGYTPFSGATSPTVVRRETGKE